MESLYACLFSTGLIKVGRSVDPVGRIAAHADRVACMGVQLRDHCTFACSGPASPREAALIARCVESASARHQNEWFAGLDFATVRGWAQECACAEGEPQSEQMKALNEAIATCDNSVTLFAERIGVGQSTVSMWRTRGRIAADNCPAIERETGVPCERLRPDIPWEVLRLQAANEKGEAWDGRTERRVA